ncbi:MAG: ABC transporter substrate-binding protein, partial [Deltaproteobacteria bacterium]|nr:ABC transporter substrate-binding protein [Deltaproteobacteria bacterium]
VEATYCQTLDQDFTAQLSAIMAAKPDVLYMPNNYTEIALACKQAIKLGLNVPIISADRTQTEELIKIGGTDVEGIIFTGHFIREVAVTDIARKYIETYEKETGKEASAFDALGADAYFILMDSIRRAKSVTGKNIRNAFVSTKNFKAVSGIINIDKGGDAVKSLVLLHVKDGTFRYLATYNP